MLIDRGVLPGDRVAVQVEKSPEALILYLACLRAGAVYPVSASGARVLVTLLHEMAKRDAKKGLATLCIGGGMGIAMCIARD